MTGLGAAVLGALLVAALMTLGDLAWTRLVSWHRPLWGLLHGAVLCLAMGGYLGGLRRRALRGGLGGLVVGLATAASFYALAPLLGYGAMLVAWMGLWMGLAFLDRRRLGGVARSQEALGRGALAAVGSGLAFYAISGIWTHPRAGGPNYGWHFVCWTVAFLPGFLALLVRLLPADRPRPPAAAGGEGAGDGSAHP